MTELIESGWSHYVIIGCSVVGLVWGGINAMLVSLIEELMLLASASSLSVSCNSLTPSIFLSLGQQNRARREQDSCQRLETR